MKKTISIILILAAIFTLSCEELLSEFSPGDDTDSSSSSSNSNQNTVTVNNYFTYPNNSGYGTKLPKPQARYYVSSPYRIYLYSDVSGVTIKYTTDGTDPVYRGRVYTGYPVYAPSGTVIMTYSTKPGYSDSDTAAYFSD